MPLATPDTNRFLEELETDAAFWAEFRETLLPVVQEIWRTAFLAGAALAEAAHPPDLALGFKDVDVEAINGAADQWIANYSTVWWNRLEEAQRKRLRAAIQRARAEGLSPKAVAELIAEDFSPARALRIAVTEVTNALGGGAQAQYRLEGYQTYEWRTAEDDKVCPLCSERDGQEFPMSTPFEALHSSCRCWPVPGELPPYVEMMQAVA